jgi:4-hydroxy-3-methylbut-2-enyl diphosphate reductase
MRFTATVVLALATVASTVNAFAPPTTAFAPRTVTVTSSTRIFQSTEAAEAAAETEDVEKTSKKQERLRMMKSDRFFRKGFKEVREESEQTMNSQFQSSVVNDLKTNNFVMDRDGVKVYLAKVCTP